MTWTRKAAVRPQEPHPEPQHDVCFLDRIKAGVYVPRRVLLDCLPAQWIRLEGHRTAGMIRRVWILETGASGPVYREQLPTRYQPTVVYIGNKHGGAPRAIPANHDPYWADL